MIAMIGRRTNPHGKRPRPVLAEASNPLSPSQFPFQFYFSNFWWWWWLHESNGHEVRSLLVHKLLWSLDEIIIFDDYWPRARFWWRLFQIHAVHAPRWRSRLTHDLMWRVKEFVLDSPLQQIVHCSWEMQMTLLGIEMMTRWVQWLVAESLPWAVQ